MSAKKTTGRKPASKTSGKTAPSVPTTKKLPMAQRASALKPKKAPASLPYEQGKWAAAFVRKAGEVRNWLVKSEVDVFSFDDLLAAPKKTTRWDGVRNTGARNFLRDAMTVGDQVFYYHSNAEPSAIVGICEVVRAGYPDPTAFDKDDRYFDADSNAEQPMWFAVDVRAVRKLAREVTLPELKAAIDLQEMALLRVGRLSVVPVTVPEWNIVIDMSERAPK